MDSKLVTALGLEHNPVVLLWVNEKPCNAVEFGVDKWGCIMFHLAAAAKGKTAVIGRDTFGCPGGGVGMGFGNQYLGFPGGCESFYRFLADGNQQVPECRQIGEGIAAAGNRDMADEFLQGERYLKNADASRRFVESMPIQDIPATYVVLRPMVDGDLENDDVRSITMLVTPDQLSALVVLANHEHPERENVGIPFAAGCQILGVFMYRERQKDQPRALVGMTDLSARKAVRRALGTELMSFSVTPEMFRDMEANVDDSFFSRHTWAALRETAK